jgi:hypothetical protein
VVIAAMPLAELGVQRGVVRRVVEADVADVVIAALVAAREERRRLKNRHADSAFAARLAVVNQPGLDLVRHALTPSAGPSQPISLQRMAVPRK